jgi:hypothetical protein
MLGTNPDEVAGAGISVRCSPTGSVVLSWRRRRRMLVRGRDVPLFHSQNLRGDIDGDLHQAERSA